MNDLEADFQAFYQVDDIQSLDAPKFFRLARRVAYYGGVMTEITGRRGPIIPREPDAVNEQQQYADSAGLGAAAEYIEIERV